VNNNYWHFNRGLTEDPDVAIRGYLDNISAERMKMTQDLAKPSNKNKCLRALWRMGNLSHAYQDYYAHGILRTSDGSAATIGVITGNPDTPGRSIKPSSWGGPWHSGEHGFLNVGLVEPGDRASDAAERRTQAQQFSQQKFQRFAYDWMVRCKCFIDEIFSSSGGGQHL
jgi:hypothetical protein